jgi:hypothetical protein
MSVRARSIWASGSRCKGRDSQALWRSTRDSGCSRRSG